MKNFSLIFVFFFMWSCNNKGINKKKEFKLDSIINDNVKLKENVFLKFGDILSKEKGNDSDTSLIKKYKSLIGQNKLLNFYLQERIIVINKRLNSVNNLLDSYFGIYKAQSNNPVDKIKITKDSTFLFKNSKLLFVKNNNYHYSSDEFTDGRIFIGRYYVKLNSSFKNKVFVSDNLCMDCPEFILLKSSNKTHR